MVVLKVAKLAGKGAWKTGKSMIASKFNVGSQLEKALKMKDVQEAYRNYQGNPENFKQGLRAYLEQVYSENYKLRNFARTVDSANRATIPIDAALDYFNIMGGVGYAAKGLKTLAMLPGYLAYDLYYTAKTKDLLGGLVINPVYEILSWASLGALPHVLAKYSKQADKYMVKEASKRFLSKISRKNLEDVVDSGSDVIARIGGREERRRAA